MLKPSACNLAIIKSSGEQSNSLDRIVSLSVHFFQELVCSFQACKWGSVVNNLDRTVSLSVHFFKNLSALFKLVNEAVWCIDSFVESQLIKWNIWGNCRYLLLWHVLEYYMYCGKEHMTAVIAFVMQIVFLKQA